MAAALWLGAGWLLWRTSVPGGLEVTELPLGAPAPVLGRAQAYAGGARLLALGVLLAPVAGVICLALVASRLAARLRGPRIVQSLSLLAVVLGTVWASALPFRLALHHRRRAYGLAEQSDVDWLVAPWLETLAGTALAGVALVAAILLARRFGRAWWVPAAPLLAALGAAAVLLQPLVLAPRLEPLPDGPLAADVRALSAEAGLGGTEVEVKRAAERTTALNAEVAGLGPTRRIVLWDTLLDGRVPRREIRALVAHELAHEERRHLLKGVAWFALVAPLLTGLVAVFVRRRGGVAEPAAVPVAVLALLLAQLALLPAANLVSRRYEAESDWRALELTRDPAAVRGLLGRFVAENLSDPAPPTWSRLLFGTHPTLEQRAGMARAWERRSRASATSRGAASRAGP